MDLRTLELLEFPKVLQRIASYAVSASGRAACLQLSPLESSQRQEAAALVQEILDLSTVFDAPLEGFPEIEGVLEAIRTSRVILDSEELLLVLDVLRGGHVLGGRLRDLDARRYPLVARLVQQLDVPPRAWSALRRCLGSDGSLRDEASPELYSVRQEIRRIQQQCTRRVQDVLLDPSKGYILQNDYLTISADRYVLAVKTNFKGQLSGIVHDYSQTGETCYIEPFFLVELNNTLQDLRQEERVHIRKVLEFLTQIVREEEPKIRTFFQILVRWDVLWALRTFTMEYDAHLVQVSADAPVHLYQARHPLLVAQHGQSVVPMDITLRQGERVLVITGGNAGGKTVALKTLGLAAILAHAAIPVPAAPNSTLPEWDSIVVSMGDEQSLERSLSTFTAQIHTLAALWEDIGPHTLVLLDEFGVGTDPSQGAALAQALVDELMAKGAWVVLATHFPALKAYGLSRPGVRAASVLFCPETGRPLYRLAYDQVGSSRALDVAREHGLPESVLSRAQDYLYLDAGDAEAVFQRLNALAAQKERELDAWRRECHQIHQQLERERERLRQERERLAGEIRAEAQSIVRAWREGRQGRKEALRQLVALRAAPASEVQPIFSAEAIAPGQRLVYIPWKRDGRVLAVDDRKGRVQMEIGGVTLWVPRDQVRPSARTASSPLTKAVTVHSAPQQGSSIRLDIRGLRTHEAVMEVERFVDRALLAGHQQVDILHGTGTGALRRAVHDALRRNPAVRELSSAPPDQGGEGVTMVTLGA
jgi:DNA mismatch repair protein MutS2